MHRIATITPFFRRILLVCVVLSFCFQACFAEPVHSKTKTKTQHSSQSVTPHKNKKKKHVAHAKKTTQKKHHPQIVTEDKPLIPEVNLATTSNENSASNFISSVGKNIIAAVYKTVSSLRYSKYQLGGSHFDTENGVYILDCSNFVDRLLQKTTPHAYFSLVDAMGVDKPATSHYYEFFSGLSDYPNNYWNKIDDVEQLRPGDILVFRYKNTRGTETGGHVMVVMDTPTRDENVFFVRVADSASGAHSEDTRQPHTSGIGIGTLLLKTNPETGKPSAYAWGVNSYWKKNVNFAMARPLEIDS